MELPRQVIENKTRERKPAPDGHLYKWQVLEKLGCGKTTLYREIKKGLLPSALPYNNKSCWKTEQVEAYLRLKLGA